MATNPTDLGVIVDQSTIIPTAWGQGINDWVYGAYGVLGGTFTAAAFRSAIIGETSKAGTASYDLTTATGDQVITGVGFLPTRVHLVVGISGALQQSVGFSDGTNNYCLVRAYSVTADGINAASAIMMRVGAADYQVGTVTFGADGFTIHWVKTGSPTGTATIAYIAER